MVAGAQRASDGHHGHGSPRGDGADNLILSQNGSDIQIGSQLGAVSASYARQTSGDLLASPTFGVRRLTPLECERLMGWPDEWTRYTANRREIPDSHRYRMCGNGVIATVAEWLGHRLVKAERFRVEQAA